MSNEVVLGRCIFVALFLMVTFAGTSTSTAHKPQQTEENNLVGGGPTTTRWPHHLALLKQSPANEYEYHCGATLIGDMTSSSSLSALTSAHCIWDDQTPGDYLMLGATNHLDDTSDAVYITIGAFTIHESYDGVDSSYDIALMTDLCMFVLSGTIINGTEPSEPIWPMEAPLYPANSPSFTEIYPPFVPESEDAKDAEDAAASLVAPIGLVHGNFKKENCTLLGWGQTGTEISPFDLQELHLRVIKKRRCRQFRPDVTKRQICAWNGPNSNQSACFGDSGGPLLCPSSQGSLVLVGIISFGPQDCSSTKPDVFIKISAFDNWIYEKLAAP